MSPRVAALPTARKNARSGKMKEFPKSRTLREPRDIAALHGACMKTKKKHLAFLRAQGSSSRV